MADLGSDIMKIINAEGIVWGLLSPEKQKEIRDGWHKGFFLYVYHGEWVSCPDTHIFEANDAYKLEIPDAVKCTRCNDTGWIAKVMPDGMAVDGDATRCACQIKTPDYIVAPEDCNDTESKSVTEFSGRSYADGTFTKCDRKELTCEGCTYKDNYYCRHPDRTVAPRSDYSCWTAKEPKCKLCNGFGFDPLRLPLGAVKCKCQIKTPDYGKLQTTASECEYGCTDGKIVIPHGFLGKEVHDCPIHKEEPKYRPYKDASEVPVPFVFRIGNTSRRIYPQYVSANGIAYRAPDTGYVILIEYEELFKQCIQHNGEPCGIRI